MKEKESKYVLGLDYGTDSCRGLLVDVSDGRRIATAICDYPRWKAGMFCNPSEDMYRQHPLDYIESLETVVKQIRDIVGPEIFSNIKGISFDTTASTPALVDETGIPLALLPEFENCPDAMFVLWKDHTAKKEADDINFMAKKYEVDYTSYSGGKYSAEWAWSKVLHILRSNPEIRSKAYSWVEHCDWMSALLSGNTRPETMFRSRCAAGHKAMWREEWGGLPSEEFLSALDPDLGKMRSHLYEQTWTADKCVGHITSEFAERLGLPADVKIALGSVDAHVGAVGALISESVLTCILGTSTCDILVARPEDVSVRPVRGICGQVDGSVVPGLVGFEAGQSAFGDLYAWLRNVLMWTVEEFVPEKADEVKSKVIARLGEQAQSINPKDSALVAVDWMNGRRTPDVNQNLKGAIMGITLSTTAPMIFRALVEATAFGTKAIVDRYISEGVRIDSVIAIGGISRKSSFVMQTLANVLGKRIDVVDEDQACALGAAIFASVASGIFPDLKSAQQCIGPKIGESYIPDERLHKLYLSLYKEYKDLGNFIEDKIAAHL